jgi:hypothetical protein
MKKVALSFLGLLAVSSFAFAADMEVAGPLKAVVAAEGKSTFGYDLDTGYYGVANTASASLYLNLVGDVNGDADASKAVTDKPGQISASFRLGFIGGAGAVGAVERDFAFDYAKIVLGDLAIKIAGVTDPSIGTSGAVTLEDGTLYSGATGGTSISVGGISLIADPQTSTGGLELVYTLPGLAAITLDYGNTLDYTATSGTQTFEYKAGLALDSKLIPGLAFGASYAGGTASTNISGASVNVGFAIDKLLSLGVTANLNLATSVQQATVNLNLPLLTGFNLQSVTGYLSTGSVISEGIQLKLGKELLGIATLRTTVYLADVSNTSAYTVFADLELPNIVDGVSPYVNSTIVGSTDLNVTAGANLTKLIDGVTFNANYTTKNLVAKKTGLVTFSADIAY